MRLLMPTTLDEALRMKAREPAAVPVAGGTDLLVRWPEQTDRDERTLLDLSGVHELRGLAWSDAALRLGALATYWDVLQDERAGVELTLLHEAAPQVGAIQIQARGTWAGNIANASPAADGVPVLMAYDAEVELASWSGARRVPLDGFYHGYKKLESRPEELITAVHVPRRAHDFVAFVKVGPRRAQAITKVGVALARSSRGWRVVANSVAPTVCRCRAIERRLDEGPLRSPDDLLEAIDADVAPIDDIRSTASYRRRVLARIIFHAASEASTT
jgi:CO/xanthine dehydrogenase FAD-binding subunit